MKCLRGVSVLVALGTQKAGPEPYVLTIRGSEGIYTQKDSIRRFRSLCMCLKITRYDDDPSPTPGYQSRNLPGIRKTSWRLIFISCACASGRHRTLPWVSKHEAASNEVASCAPTVPAWLWRVSKHAHYLNMFLLHCGSEVFLLGP